MYASILYQRIENTCIIFCPRKVEGAGVGADLARGRVQYKLVSAGNLSVAIFRVVTRYYTHETDPHPPTQKIQHLFYEFAYAKFLWCVSYNLRYYFISRDQ